MLSKRLIYKRGVMIALAVVALMTLTAGVAAAASNEARKIEAIGGVGGVGLNLGGTVGSHFKITDGVINKVKITTVGEGFGGLIGAVTACEQKGEHGEGACDSAGDILNGALIESTHKSKATLNVLFINEVTQTLVGTLKGSLKADLRITGANLEVLDGHANLKINSGVGPSAYNCLVGVDFLGSPIWGLIQTCVDSPGPNALGVFDVSSRTYPLDPTAGPVLVPVELHVVDTGKFHVKNDSGKIEGKISVTVDSVGGVASGVIVISEGEATFSIEGGHQRGKDKHGKGDDEDEEDEEH